jgi:hypothetical protein
MAPTQVLLHPPSAAAPATQPLSPPVSATVDVEMQHDGQPPGSDDATRAADATQPLLAPQPRSHWQPLSPHESATDGGATVGEAAGLEDATQLLRPPLVI